MPDSNQIATQQCLIDGEWGASVPIDDRGLNYGDGVFETIAVSHGKPLQMEQHLARLQRGCDVLRLGPVDGAQINSECGRLANGTQKAVLKVIITRGSGGRGYRPAATPLTRRAISLHQWPSLPPFESDAKAFVCSQRLHDNPALAGIKHLNRLEQVLASHEWPDATYLEGLMRDTDGHFVAGTKSNLFVIQGSRLQTPPVDRCGIAGVVRAAVLRHAPDCNLETELIPLDSHALETADEVFVTNSIMGVRTLEVIDGVRSKKPVKANQTAALIDALRKAAVIV